jgi:hypothetical protein
MESAKRFADQRHAISKSAYPEAREECWHIYYGDVHAGTVAIRSGKSS